MSSSPWTLSAAAAATVLSGCLLIPPSTTTVVSAFIAVPNNQISRSIPSCKSRIHSQSQQLIDLEDEEQTTPSTSTPRKSLDPKQAEKFKIVTCMSTSCSKKRQVLGLDDLHTFTQFYARINDDHERNGGVVSAETAAALKSIQLEEGPCLGACKRSPCVAIEHDDYVGSVSLESGMTQEEFNDRV